MAQARAINTGCIKKVDNFETQSSLSFACQAFLTSVVVKDPTPFPLPGIEVLKFSFFRFILRIISTKTIYFNSVRAVLLAMV